MTASSLDRLDQRLRAADSLLTRRRALPSGLALLAALAALVLSALLLIFLLTAGPKAIAAPAESAPKADFQLSGSAFTDAPSAPSIPSGSEPAR